MGRRAPRSAAPYEDYYFHRHVNKHYLGLRVGGYVGGRIVEMSHYALGVVDGDLLRDTGR